MNSRKKVMFKNITSSADGSFPVLSTISTGVPSVLVLQFIYKLGMPMPSCRRFSCFSSSDMADS